MKGVSACIFFLCAVLGATANNDWIKKEAFGGGKRERLVSFSIGGRGYACMGQDTAEMLHRDLWEYDPSVDSWTQKANCPGIPRRNACVFVIGTSAYVGTGMDNALASIGNTLSDFWEYSPLTNTWLQRASCPIGGGWGAYYCSAFSINGKGYVVCGKLGPSQYTNQCWEFTPSTNSWLQRSSFPGSVRYGTYHFVLNNMAYVGMGADENAFASDIWAYNPSMNSWSSIGNFPAAARFSGHGFALLGKGYILMGTDGGYKDELFEYDPQFNSWVQRKSFEGGGRRNAICFVIGNRAYAGAGKGSTGCRRDFWEYTPFAPLSVTEFSSGDFPAKLFPNPVETTATLDLRLPEGERSYRYLITDVRGQQQRESLTCGASTVEIRKGNLITGSYFLQVFTETGLVTTVPFIVK
ncbi:MAG: hypothetical protein IT233_13995 [Bacteroidia bacterium]|nr:hypothetical protein [Bacteroidia bacterium]